MKKGKKLIALLLVTVLTVCSFTACGKKDDKTTSSQKKQSTAKDDGKLGDATLKVWGAQDDQDMLATMVENFKKLHPEAKINVEFGVVAESDAKTELLKDVSVGADVFAFASDQIAELQSAGALYRVTMNKDAIVAANTPASIQACTVDGEMYAYPSSADTYFMYYDKSKYTEDEVKNLDTMMAKDLGKGITNFSFDNDNGWYLSSFFFAAGCTLFGEDGTDSTVCSFNDENGLKVGQYLLDLASNPKFANNDDPLLLAGFADGTLGATFSGTWNAAAIQESLGDNYGVAKLPTFNLDGKETQLSSMANFKLYGVNAQTKCPKEAMALAEYLTSQDCQKIRFEQRSFAPTNVNLANDKAALATNPAVAAVAEQTQFAKLQTAIPQVGQYWKPAEAFGTGINDKSITKDNLQEKLDEFVDSVLSSIG